MKSVELANNLEILIEESGYRSILIDGPWGCGKTHEINKFMSKTKKGVYMFPYLVLNQSTRLTLRFIKHPILTWLRLTKWLPLSAKRFLL